MLILNAQDNIQINFEQDEKIGIKVSGGADSAIVAYMLAKYKMEHNPSVKLKPISYITPEKVPMIKKIDAILECITRLTGVEWHHPVVYNLSSSSEPMFTDEREEHNTRLFNAKAITSSTAGITRNPPDSIAERWIEEIGPLDNRDPNADKHPQYTPGTFLPLINIDKKGVRELYDTFGVFEELYPLTFSCEDGFGKPIETIDYSKHCGTCWWCLEREWGFGRLV